MSLLLSERPKPSWLVRIAAAKAQAFAEMTDAERAAAAEARDALRDKAELRKARRAAATERIRNILDLRDAGHTTAEVAKALGRSANTIRNIAIRRGVFLSRSDSFATYSVPVSIENRSTLRALAARQGTMSDAQALEWLVGCLLGHDGQLAKFVMRNPDGVRAAVARAFTIGGAT